MSRTLSPLESLLEPNSPIRRLADRFADNGNEFYLVGGPVRDAALGRARRDLDFATDASPERTHDIIKPIARSVWLQGARFGTVGAQVGDTHVEITTFRTERYRPESDREARRRRSEADQPPDQAESWISWFHSVAAGEVAEVSRVVPNTTGHPARSLEDAVRAWS